MGIQNLRGITIYWDPHGRARVQASSCTFRSVNSCSSWWCWFWGPFTDRAGRWSARRSLCGRSQISCQIWTLRLTFTSWFSFREAFDGWTRGRTILSSRSRLISFQGIQGKFTSAAWWTTARTIQWGTRSCSLLFGCSWRMQRSGRWGWSRNNILWTTRRSYFRCWDHSNCTIQNRSKEKNIQNKNNINSAYIESNLQNRISQCIIG